MQSTYTLKCIFFPMEPKLADCSAGDIRMPNGIMQRRC